MLLWFSGEVGQVCGLLDGVHVAGHLLAVEAHVVSQDAGVLPL
jgi:hypothetical protein